jgi:hypothetical protein
MTFKQLVFITALILVGIQFIPVERTNPPIETRAVGPDPVMQLLRRSCFDCHSNETEWPWYGKVAPFSWAFAHDVNKGREKLNFSEWNRLSQGERDRRLDEIWKRVKSGDMPPALYVFGNQEARVTTDHHRMIRQWCGQPPN